jgi:hypothetical protein
MEKRLAHRCHFMRLSAKRKKPLILSQPGQTDLT